MEYIATSCWSQRVLDNLWRTRLSRRRMIWLLPSPSPVSKLSFFFSLACVSPVDGRWEGGGEEPNNGESLVLYQSFNTLGLVR